MSTQLNQRLAAALLLLAVVTLKAEGRTEPDSFPILRAVESSAHPSDVAAVHFAEGDGAHKVTVNAGQSLEVTLAGKRGTGYEWMLLTSVDAVRGSFTFDPKQDYAVKARAYEYRFRDATASPWSRSREVHLQFGYARRWEKKDPDYIANLTVTIESRAEVDASIALDDPAGCRRDSDCPPSGLCTVVCRYVAQQGSKQCVCE